jgi:hypothetical protein
MNKLLLSVIVGVILLALPLPAQAAAPAPRDYYKLGQFLGSTVCVNAFQTASMDLLRQKLARERQVLVNLGANQAVMNDYDKMTNAYLQLPFTIPVSQWTQAQIIAWQNATMNWNDVNAWLPAGDCVQRFFFWLGYQTVFVVKIGPMELNLWGYGLASTQPYYKSPLTDFSAFAADFPNSIKTISPAEQQAIQALAAYNGRMPNASDIGAMQVQGEVIYEAENGKSSQ